MRRCGEAFRLLVGAALVAASLCLTGGAAVAQSATAPATTARTAPDAPVRMRAGEHATFVRLVFDWEVPVEYTLGEAGGRVTLRFNRPAAIDLGRFAGDRLRDIGGLAAKRLDDASEVTFAASGRLRHFRDGFHVVVDVLAEKTASPERPAAPPAPARTAAAAPPPPPPAAVAPPRALVPAAATTPAASPQTPAPQTPATQTPSPQAAPVAPAAPAPAPVAAPPVARPSMMAMPFPGESAAQAAAPGADMAALPPDTPRLDVAVQKVSDGAVLTFPFPAGTASAWFRRGGRLWLVFDRLARIDTEALAASAGDIVTTIEQLPHGEATVLRLVTLPGFNPGPGRDGDGWTVVLAARGLHPERAVDSDLVQDTNGRPQLALRPVIPGKPLVLRDPEVGDALHVVPVARRGVGVEKRVEAVDFEVLTTAQGIAVVPRTDGLQVRTGSDGVIVAGPGGLNLTPGEDRRRVLAAAAGETRRGMFDFIPWRHAELGDYNQAYRRMLARVIEATPAERNAARLELARFLFAHGMHERAAGVLAAIAHDSPELARAPAIRALVGANAWLGADSETAREAFGDHALDGEADIELWRAALAAEAGDWPGAALAFRQSTGQLTIYPPRLVARFTMLAAESFLAVHDSGSAVAWLDALGNAGLTRADRVRRDILRGRVAAVRGDVEEALTLYQRAIDSGDRWARARATFDRVELLVGAGRMEAKEAIDVLDGLRHVWRGDDLEFAILRREGELQLDTGALRDGLRTLKRAVANFPDHPQVAALTDTMREAFRRIFLDGEADTLTPVAGIALFNEFRDLAPAGPEGDRLIGTLVDRLVAVDLLTQADELLTHQVTTRLRGVPKAGAGARLATVRLLDRNAAGALEALDQTATAGLPADLAAERNRLTARARLETGEGAKALALIEGDGSPAGERLRAEIHWRAADWRAAAAAYARLTGAPPVEGAKIDPKLARWVLNRAVALALAGDRYALSRLRDGWAKAMDATPLGPDFRVATLTDSAARDFADVMARLAEVDEFRAFLDASRQRAATPPQAANLVN
ncbi:MAG: tetratricopeptide repeat protein [Alphaproteobacteria bacterium]